ncbi:class I adenylate-forming enzyme family protein [Alphaproteobacteria bacterium LSUCC0684]
MADLPRDLRQQIEFNARTHGDKQWLVSPETGKTVSYAEAVSRVREIAAHLAGLGFRPGDRIAVAAHNSIGSCLAFMGITYGGFHATPLNLVAGARVMAYVLNHSGAGLIFVADDCRVEIEEAAAEAGTSPQLVALHPEKGPDWPEGATPSEPVIPSSEAPALLMYTSGTTGNPKGVMLSHANLLAAGRNVADGHGIGPDDAGLCVLPIYHINGLCVTVMGTLVSASTLVMPYRFSVNRFWDQIKSNNCSWFSAVPTLFAYLLNSPDDAGDLGRLRFSRSASSPLPPEIHRRFEDRFGIPIIETMGLTETGAQILSNPMPPAERKIGSPGVAVGNEVIIGDENQQPVAPGVTGEILVRGDNVMLGYLNQPDETAKTITADGWLRTGDLGHMDEDGYVFVSGRIKELIIKGGENIAPREIDEVLLEHPSVLEAAAFSMPCDKYGERVEACIRLKDGKDVEIDHLIRHCQERLGKFKSPDMVHVLDDLPKGPSGKVQRMKLKPLVYPDQG